MIKKTLEEIISDYGIDGNVVNDLAKAIREYYKEAMSGIRAVGSKTTFNTPFAESSVIACRYCDCESHFEMPHEVICSRCHKILRKDEDET